MGIKRIFGSNCWICEGWVQVPFKIDIAKLNGDPPTLTKSDEVFLHLEADDYEPCVIKETFKGIYETS